jgi:hypothetical protein
MPTLNWIGKDAVVNHHQQVAFHLLKDVPDLACVMRSRRAFSSTMTASGRPCFRCSCYPIPRSR